MFMITSGILTRSHVDFIIRTFLCFFTHHIPFSLLSNNLVDETFLALEVIAHFLRFIRRIAILKDRQSGFHSCTVYNTTGKDRTTVHVHGNDFGSQFNLLIIHLTLAIQMHQTIQEHDRVIGFIHHRSIQRFFLFRSHRINSKSILSK